MVCAYGGQRWGQHCEGGAWKVRRGAITKGIISHKKEVLLCPVGCGELLGGGDFKRGVMFCKIFGMQFGGRVGMHPMGSK